MSTIEVAYKASCTVKETLSATEAPGATADQRIVKHDGFNSSGTYSSSTTVTCTKVAAFTKALVGGAGTIDLTALDHLLSTTVDGTGLKVQFMKVKSVSTNTNAFTLDEGAANGYALMGAAWSTIIQPEQEWLFFGNNATPDVAAADKIIDLAGNGTESIEVLIVLG